MFEEDDRPRVIPALTPRKLEGLSKEDLREYIEFLASERLRAEQALDAKGGMVAAAAALFKS